MVMSRDSVFESSLDAPLSGNASVALGQVHGNRLDDLLIILAARPMASFGLVFLSVELPHDQSVVVGHSSNIECSQQSSNSCPGYRGEYRIY